MKSSIILASTLTLIAPILAAPTGETSGTLVARDNAKLNQYNHPDCKDDNNSNVPIYHAAPPMWKCYNIDASTESFFWNLGPLSYLWAYEQDDCGGEFATLAGYDQSGCHSASALFKYGEGEKRIRSVVMH